MKSIRTFLVIVLMSTITLVMFVAALRGYQASVAQAEELFDAELLQELHLIGRLVDDKVSLRRPNNGNYRIDPTPFLHLAVFDEQFQVETAFQIWSESGELLLKSSSAPQYRLTELQPGFVDINYAGYRWRALADFNDATRLWIVVAERHDIRYALADSIILESLLPLVIALPLLALLTWAIVSFGLRPVETLAADISKRGERSVAAVDTTCTGRADRTDALGQRPVPPARRFVRTRKALHCRCRPRAAQSDCRAENPCGQSGRRKRCPEPDAGAAESRHRPAEPVGGANADAKSGRSGSISGADARPRSV